METVSFISPAETFTGKQKKSVFSYPPSFKFIKKINKIQNMMHHCSQLATAIRGEQWLDALDEIFLYNTK